MDYLLSIQNRLLNKLDFSQKRYLYDQIDWNQRLIQISGQRGVGKSTLLLQHIKETDQENKTLYISADSLSLYHTPLHEIALEHYQNGGERLFIDEIHKYPNWSIAIKHIYDSIPELRVVYSGSSILELLKGNADLSRRAAGYQLQPLSFREYLAFEKQLNYPTYTFEEIANGNFNETIETPIYHFKQYLKRGVYPFYKEGLYEQKLMQVINTVIEVDLLQYFDLKASTVSKLKQLLQIVAESVPFKPNLSKLADKTGISRNLLSDYLKYLEKSGLIVQLPASTKGIQAIGKAEKIYLSNTNLSYALLGKNQVNLGNARETFFLSQIQNKNLLSIPKKGDFQIGNLTIEVGGKNKDASQLRGVEEYILAKDNIEIAYKRQIPLWQFGFLY
ncbi:MAG: AAA family ATPase [Vicingaceae bacterium]